MRGWTDLFAVFVGDDGPLCGACVCTKDDAIVEETADDGGAGACCLGQTQALVGEVVVAADSQRRRHQNKPTHRSSLVKSKPMTEAITARASCECRVHVTL